jgi:hypothetical protein
MGVCPFHSRHLAGKFNRTIDIKLSRKGMMRQRQYWRDQKSPRSEHNIRKSHF